MSASASTRPAAAAEPTRGQRLTLIAALGVGTFTTALSNSVLNTILPLISNAFQTDISAVEWIVTAFLLVQSGLLLTFGRLGDMIGHRRVYLLGLAVFILSLGLCVLAPSVPLLIGARILQAVGASMFIANSPPILTAFFPPSQRGQVLGIQASTVYVGLAAGAPIGGFLADLFGWQSVFLVPIPFAAIALVTSFLVLRKDVLSNRRERFDLIGAAVYLVGLVMLLLALNRGRSWGWTSELTIGCLLVGLVTLVVFVVHERRTPSPMLNLSLFNQRAFTAPVISSMMNYSASAGTVFLLPFALIEGRGLSPGQVGLVLTWQPIVMAVMASVSGGLSDKIGARIPATVGMTILSISLVILSQMGLETPLWELSATLALVGLGIGLFTSPNNSSVLGAVGPERRGVASGILSTARTLGNVLGIGVAGAVYATVLAMSGGGHAPAQVVNATSYGMMVAAGLAAVGAVTSFTRPPPSKLEM
ncbi:MAG: MFS transporter [Chloroflexi bacterium]|nr:MFS transporter [Chloroflexota bacterium]